REAQTQPTERRPLLAFRKLDAELPIEFAEGRISVSDGGAVRELVDRARRLVGNFTEYFPDQFFEQVLHRDDAGRAAVLVDHESHVRPPPSHLLQELGRPDPFGDEVSGPQEIVNDDELTLEC